VKLFQSFSLNNHFIDQELNNKLLEYTDNVPWNESEIYNAELREIILKYNLFFDCKLENKINFIKPKPINSGMISLVYKVYNVFDNKQYVIKMKRKNIEHKINDAIDNLQFMIYFFSYFSFTKYYIDLFKLPKLIEQNVNIIKQQINFQMEVKNILKMKNICKNLKYIKIPEVNEKITEQFPNFIMMEFIDGLKINQLKEADYKPFSKQVIKFGLVSAYIYGISHGDLHCGNILFIKDFQENYINQKNKYKLGLIDFGLLYELNTYNREKILDIMVNLKDTSTRELAIKFLSLDNIKNQEEIFAKLSKEQFLELVEIVEKIIVEIKTEKKFINFQKLFYGIFIDLNNFFKKEEFNHFNIEFSEELVKMQMVLLATQGTVLKLCKNEFWDLLNEVSNEIWHPSLLIN